MKTCGHVDSLRGSSDKIGTIQRRLAWPLRKDDTREVYQEREYQGHDAKNVYNKWYADRRHMKAYQSTKTLRGIDVDATMMGFNIENLTAKQALMDAKEKHARRWQTKEGTYRLKEKLLPDVRDTDVEMIDSSTAHQ